MEVKDLFVVRPTNEEQNDFIVTVGRHLATEKHFESREEAEQYIETPQWDMIIAMTAEMFEAHKIEEHTKKDSKK